MRCDINRRDLVQGAGLTFALAAGTSWSTRGLAAEAPAIPSWSTEFRQIAPGVYAYVQAGGPTIPYSGISNAGVLAGPDGLIAVDSLPAPLQTKAMLAATARTLPGQAFKRLIYTHHHGDHIDGAQFFPPVEIVGTEFSRRTIAAMAPLPNWEKREGWAEGGEPHKRLPPTTTLEGVATYYMGDMAVKVMPVNAHTDGDLLVYLPDRKVLFAGDVAFFYIAPYAHWASLSKWIDLCDRILDMDVVTIVPGHGPLGGKREMADMREYLVLFRKEARARFDAGMSPGKAAASITTMGRFDSWRGARDRLAMNTVRAFHEFSGTLTPEMDAKGTAAAIAEYTAITGYQPQS
jgi:cyclase